MSNSSGNELHCDTCGRLLVDSVHEVIVRQVQPWQRYDEQRFVLCSTCRTAVSATLISYWDLHVRRTTNEADQASVDLNMAPSSS